MRYDINLIHELCREIGLSSRIDADQRVEVDLGQGAVLSFQNSEKEEDCLIGFLGTPWHTHDDLMFTDTRGNYAELEYLDLVIGLKEGRVLICELLVQDRVVDRWLTHRDYNNESKYMEEGEQIVVRRAATNAAGAGQSHV